MPLINHHKAAKKRRRRRKRRLLLERLEARLVFATINWDGGPDGLGTNWNNLENWDGDSLPGPDSDVVIDGFAGTTIVSSQTQSVNTIMSDANLTISGGTLTIGNDADDTSRIDGTYTQLEGALAGSGSLALAGPVNWVGKDPAPFSPPANAISHSNVQVLGAFTLSGEHKAVLAGGHVTINGAEANAANWTSGRLDVHGTLTNAGEWAITTDRLLGGNGRIRNLGSITKSVAAGSQTVEPKLDNDGTVTVEVGELEIVSGNSAGEADDGVWSVLGPATLRLQPNTASETRTISAGATLTGAGELELGFAGTVNVNADTFTHSGRTKISGGTVALNTWSGSTEPVTISGGSALFNVDATLHNLEHSGGRLAGSSSRIDVVGSYDWIGKDPAPFSPPANAISHGNVQVQGVFTMSGDHKAVLAGGHVTINGAEANAASWTGGRLDVHGTLTNAGEWTITNDLLLGGNGRIHNFGVITKSVAAGSQAVEPKLDNDGTVTVERGELRIQGSNSAGEQDDGVWDVRDAAVLVFTGPERTFGASSTIKGAGDLEFNNNNFVNSGAYTHTGHTTIRGGQLHYNVDVALPSLDHQDGWLAGSSDTVAINGPYRWTGGSIYHNNVLASGPLTMSTGRQKFVGGSGMLTNNGADADGAAWDDGHFDVAGKFINAGDFVITSNRTVRSGGKIENSGQVTKTGAAGTLIVEPRFDNNGTVTVESGELRIQGSNSAGEQDDGVWDVRDAAVLAFTGPERTFGASSTIEGAGDLEFNNNNFVNAGAYTHTGHTTIRGGQLHYNVDVALPSLDHQDGWLAGSSDTVAINGPYRWTGGSIYHSNVLASGPLTMSTGRQKFVGGSGMLTNNGADADGAAWDDGHFDVAGKFINAGDFVITTDLRIRFGGTIENTGHMTKTGSAGTLVIEPWFDNVGTLEVRTGTLVLDNAQSNFTSNGSTTLDRGAWIVTTEDPLVDEAAIQFFNIAPIAFNRGDVRLNGSGASFRNQNAQEMLSTLRANTADGTVDIRNGYQLALPGNLDNDGVLVVGAGGEVAVSGEFTQSATGVIEFGLGNDPASGDFGRLIATDDANLAGTYVVGLDNGFGPTIGQSFETMEFAARNGEFDAFEGLFLGGTQAWEVVQNPANVVVNGLANASDLVVDPFSIAVTGTGVVGANVSIDYTVNNLSETPALGDWFDSIYLSADVTLDPFDELIGRVERTGGLPGLGSYNETLVASLPAVLPGRYRVIVVQDSRGAVPDQNREDNTALSPSTFEVSYEPLAIGGSTGGVIANRERRYFQIDVPVDTEVLVSVETALADQVTLYSRLGETPSVSRFDQRTERKGRMEASLVINTPGVHYLMVAGEFWADDGETFFISAEAIEFAITDVLHNTGSNLGEATATIRGTGFTEWTTVELTNDLGEVVATAAVVPFDNEQLFATFYLVGVASGEYDLRLTENGASLTAPGKYIVTEDEPGELELELIYPSGMIAGGTIGTFAVRYENKGGTNVPAELFTVTTAGGAVRFERDTIPFTRQRAQALTISNRGIHSPVSIVAPGEVGFVWFEFDDFDPPFVSDVILMLDRTDSPDEPFDIAEYADQFRPDHLTDEAWEPLIENLRVRFGATIGEFNATLLRNADYLQRIGQRTFDVRRMVILELLNADNALSGAALAAQTDASAPSPGLSLDFTRVHRQQLTNRFTLGSLGYGWRNNWDARLVEDEDGNMFLMDESGDRFFQVVRGDPPVDLVGDSRLLDTFIGSEGFEEVLMLATDPSHGRVLRLRRANGDVFVFADNADLPTRPLLFVEDPFGNRINLTYFDGLLTTIDHNRGGSFSLEYDANDRLVRLVDHVGRETTYEYDASNEHLLRVIDATGTTEYAYDTTSNDARQHALTAVVEPNGSRTDYAYDSLGRLIRSERNGGHQPLDYTYGSGGEIVVTSADNAATTIRYDDFGRVAQLAEPNGGIYKFDYREMRVAVALSVNHAVATNTKGDLSRVVQPDGRELRFEHDNFGNLTVARDAIGNGNEREYDTRLSLGARISFRLAPRNQFNIEPVVAEGIVAPARAQNQLAAYHDELGRTSRYGFGNGNPTNIAYANGTEEVISYNADGTIDQVTNRRYQTVDYDYDARGLITTRTRSNGAIETFTYDAAGNLLTAADASGTTSYTYDDDDRLTRVSYPNGRDLSYAYDASGNRTEISDGVDFAIRYAYDAVGRLVAMRDEANAMIAGFEFDSVGRLARQDNANGVYTTYDYDGNGNVTSIVNHAPDDSVTSRFDYTYDDMGRRLATTTLDGVTSYAYDAVGNLTQVELPSGRTLQYQYDSVGNRLSVTDDGSSTDYVVDELQRTTMVGGTRREYDADGNLIIERTAAGHLTRYAYDDLSRLIGKTSPDGATTFEYDAIGNRVAAVRNGVRTEYLVDPTGIANVVAEYDGAGSATARYAHSQFGLIGRFDASGEPAFYHFDSPGSTTSITGADGVVLNEYEYLPFGELLSANETVANPFGYVGRLGVMAESDGLQFMRNRYYDANTGSFTSLDPLRYPPVELYGYALNDPLRFVDPLGLNARGGNFAGLPFGPEQGLDAIQNTSTGGAATGGLGFLASAASATAEVGSTFGGVASGVGGALIGVALASNPDTYRGVEGLVRQGRCGTTNVNAARQLAAAGFSSCEDGGTVEGFFSFDPNDIIGPAGVGPENHVRGESTFPYRIRFENIADATAPAQKVTVRHILDDDLDLDSLELKSIGFGDLTLSIPPGHKEYEARVQVRDNLYVDLVARLDREFRMIEWTFTSIDPGTLDQPANPFGGFLPPNVNSPEGEGFVTFTIEPLDGLPTGTRINAVARIVFDGAEPIDTPGIFNTIDADPPNSSVDALPAETRTDSFEVRWTGGDNGGSGVATYDVYVAVNNQPFTPWLQKTEDPSANFSGAVGNTYSFYSVATDLVRRQESKAAAGETSTLVVHANAWHNHVEPYDVNLDTTVNLVDTFSVIDVLRDRGIAARLPAEGPGPGEDSVDINDNERIDLLDAFLSIDRIRDELGDGEGEFTIPFLAQMRGLTRSTSQRLTPIDTLRPTDVSPRVIAWLERAKKDGDAIGLEALYRVAASANLDDFWADWTAVDDGRLIDDLVGGLVVDE